MKKLELLYGEIAELTLPLCSTLCLQRSNTHRCCEKKYCDIAAEYAKKYYSIELRDTGHAIPFMGKDGCTVPPHLRPICAMHSCAINWNGRERVSPELLKKYDALRSEIAEAEIPKVKPKEQEMIVTFTNDQQGAVLILKDSDGNLEAVSISAGSTIAVTPLKSSPTPADIYNGSDLGAALDAAKTLLS